MMYLPSLVVRPLCSPQVLLLPVYTYAFVLLPPSAPHTSQPSLLPRLKKRFENAASIGMSRLRVRAICSSTRDSSPMRKSCATRPRTSGRSSFRSTAETQAEAFCTYSTYLGPRSPKRGWLSTQGPNAGSPCRREPAAPGPPPPPTIGKTPKRTWRARRSSRGAGSSGVPPDPPERAPRGRSSVSSTSSSPSPPPSPASPSPAPPSPPPPPPSERKSKTSLLSSALEMFA
mmetsp:Transcript_86297/g.244620  ORF Transcript_86297/g.244620 Transcript_86297/m.244620 type:complete len:230 (+) Transcript_86297:293-982(+)